MPKLFLLLIIAVLFETIGTSLLKTSAGFTKWLPSVVSVLCFILALALLAQVLRFLPIGVVYAIWSGLGVVMVTLIGTVFFKQHLDFAGYAGIALIVIGVLVLQLLSKVEVP